MIVQFRHGNPVNQPLCGWIFRPEIFNREIQKGPLYLVRTTTQVNDHFTHGEKAILHLEAFSQRVVGDHSRVGESKVDVIHFPLGYPGIGPAGRH